MPGDVVLTTLLAVWGRVFASGAHKVSGPGLYDLLDAALLFIKIGAFCVRSLPDYGKEDRERAKLDRPCRVTTKPSEDNKYVNIEKLLAA